MDAMADFQEPDESRPAKRVRLEAPLEITEEVQEEIIDDEDWDDIYSLTGDGASGSKPVDGPGNNLAEEDLAAPTPESTLNQFVPLVRNEAEAPTAELEDTDSNVEVEDGLPPDAIDDEGGVMLQEEHITAPDVPSAMVLEETTQLETVSPEKAGGVQADDADSTKSEHGYPDASNNPNMENSEEMQSVSKNENEDLVVAQAANGDTSESTKKPQEDPEFLAAAAAQKANEAAEWQFDSSDAESSDSNSDSNSNEGSDDNDDSGSEDGYEMLDPATAAKILMAGGDDDGDDDGEKGKNKGNGDRQPRTVNEVKEEVVPKPDIVITDDMKITYLGTVDRAVDNQLLIKAVTPGEYQVLEYGSVLCTEDRQVVGAVADTFGRVQEPIYSVAFTNAQEMEDAGFEYGTKIFYVDSHSSFVFTQPLKNMKGTDASNLHDEEVGEDELEFSDDEEEAEYKRMRKAAKREGRGGLSRSTFNEERAARTFGAPGHDSGYTFMNGKERTFANGSDAPQQQYGGGMSYDDGDVQDEFYQPLKRPDNLSQLMAGDGRPRPQHGSFDRGGRGRNRGDRGRGRGDRGRGRGGFDHRNQRGVRGGFERDRGSHGQQNGHRGNAHSFPDRHNDYKSNAPQRRQQQQQSLPQKPNALQTSPPQPQQPYAAYQPYPAQQATSPQTYQFNGLTFQYGNSPPQPQTPQANYYAPQQQQQSVQSPGGSIPAGAYVNPAFFQNQQQWSSPQPQSHQQPGYGAWQQQQMQQNVQARYGASATAGASYGSNTVQQPQQPPNDNNLAEILRQLGGAQR